MNGYAKDGERQGWWQRATPVAWSGRVLMVGGVLAALVNGVLTPQMPLDGTFAELASSTIFRLRMSLAVVVTLCLLVGTIGLCAVHRERMGPIGASAFLLAFLGSASAFAHEWAQVFFIHHLAFAAPQALDLMENVDGSNLFDAEAVIALAGLTLGWLAFATYLLRASIIPSVGPVLLLVGILALPILSSVDPLIGQVLGAVTMAAGWFALGRGIAGDVSMGAAPRAILGQNGRSRNT